MIDESMKEGIDPMKHLKLRDVVLLCASESCWQAFGMLCYEPGHRSATVFEWVLASKWRQSDCVKVRRIRDHFVRQVGRGAEMYLWLLETRQPQCRHEKEIKADCSGNDN
ncbi:hypothetical protein AMECASPLE_011770 [Ameca splendens]|uniref:Uncharacterized protein n=1 Tax=Ameca splendens TaxID=208324 RepID=A0ABV0YZL2_9TELE